MNSAVNYSSDVSVEKSELFPQNSPFPVLRVHSDGTLLYANPASAPLLGFWGCQVGDRLPEDWRGIITKVLNDGVRHDTEVTTGSALLYLSLIPMPELECVQIYSFDDTPKALARKQLEENEALFRNAFHISPDSVNINRLSDGMYIDVNQGFTALTGYTRDEVIGRTSFEIDIWCDFNERLKLVEGLRKDGLVRNLEARFRMKDGSVRTSLLSGQMIQIGGEMHILSITRDISDIKNAQEALRVSEARMRSLQENIPLALYQSKPDGSIVYANPAMARMFGYSSVEELSQVPTEDLYVDAKQRTQIVEVLNKHGLIKDWEVTLKRKDGYALDCALNIRAAFDASGMLIRQDGIIIDITERKRIQAALVAAKNKAEEMNRIKSNFLATMSHELRTPLNGILGFASLLEEALLDEELSEMAGIINASGHRLLDTLNSILDLSIVEADKLNVNWDDVDVISVLTEVENLHQANAKKKGLALKSKIELNSLIIQTDERLLRQILINLLNNAVKYTRHGGVTLSIEEMHDPHRELVCIHVQDTGIGVSTKDQEVIFDEFRQASEGYSRAYDGSGLGLSVSQKFAHVLGGRITLNSTSGVGSVFTLQLPRQHH
ncbi:MAG: PAS domain S-box protein [Bacteroidota bacterium]